MRALLGLCHCNTLPIMWVVRLQRPVGILRLLPARVGWGTRITGQASGTKRVAIRPAPTRTLAARLGTET
jgi:hypothetical protein